MNPGALFLPSLQSSKFNIQRHGLWILIAVVCFTAGSAKTQHIQLAALRSASSPLGTPTYDGSGQGMHPSIWFFPARWHGFAYWMAMTPYPNYDASKENPSILASNDGQTWVLPAGLTNPVASSSNSTLADPDLFYDAASDQLWLYYIDKNYPDGTHVIVKSSHDGITWSSAQSLFSAPVNGCLSPAVDLIGSTYYLWCVNAAPFGYDAQSSVVEYRTSRDGRTWSASQAAVAAQPGFVIWHIEVRYIPVKREVWMLAAAYPVGTASGDTILFFARSPDGINWQTYKHPILTPGPGWDHGEIYRSTFLFDGLHNLLRVWYSAMGNRIWHTGYTEANYSSLFEYIEN